MPGPGEKRTIRQRRSVAGLFGDTRRAWMDAHQQKFALYVTPVDDTVMADNGTYPEPGDDIAVAIQNGRKNVMLNMSALTEEELLALKELFDMAFANARPITQRRDRLAQEAFDEGYTGNTRVYREVPRLFVREGKEFPDREVLRRGHDWVPAVDSYEVRPASKRFRSGSSDLPQRDEVSGQAEDHTAQAD